jgi:hypothetical protein
MGYQVRFTIEPKQPHRLETLAADGSARLFNQFDEARHGCPRAKRPTRRARHICPEMFHSTPNGMLY